MEMNVYNLHPEFNGNVVYRSLGVFDTDIDAATASCYGTFESGEEV